MTVNAFRGLAAAGLTLLFTAASIAADPGRAGAAPRAIPSATAPPTGLAPAVKQVLPTIPTITAKPDYAIALASQQEFENTALGWSFRIENRGLGAPSVAGGGKPGGGAGFMGLSGMSAHLVISVGQPCPNPTSWTQVVSKALPQLQPGGSTTTGLHRMPDGYAGKGCRFRAEIKGPADDANPSNNVMHMFTKTALLPDLVVVSGPALGGPGGNLDVRNVGKASAEPSTFRFECVSTNKDVSCGTVHEQHKSNVVLDVPVPALNPGQSFMVKKSTPGGGGLLPKGVTWKAYADHANSVAESSEGNNIKVGAK
jgi:hypothetical protein